MVPSNGAVHEARLVPVATSVVGATISNSTKRRFRIEPCNPSGVTARSVSVPVSVSAVVASSTLPAVVVEAADTTASTLFIVCVYRHKLMAMNGMLEEVNN